MLVDHFHGVLVVWRSEGTYQFSYTWSPPSECRLWSRGVCTDALLHTHKVEMLSPGPEISVDRVIITGVLTKLCDVQTHISESRSIINARINKLSFFKHIYRNFSHFGMPDVIFIESNTKITLFWNYSAIIFKGSGLIINQINGSIFVKWSNQYSVLT